MIDRSDSVRAIQNAATESAALLRQFHLWLALGAAGGGVTMFTLAAGSPDPDHALRFFQISLWSFLVGVTLAGASVLFLSLRSDAMADHLGSATNRDNLNDAIGKMPVTISAPQRIADEANAGRNALIAKSAVEHTRAEAGYRKFRQMTWLWRMSLLASSIAFVIGFAAPLVQISFFGFSLTPPAIDSPHD